MSLLFAMRFDFRNPAFAGTTPADRYEAAIEMAEWAERLECLSIAISEHHTSAYGAWQAQDDVASPYHTVADGAALRATGQYDVLTPAQYVAELQAAPFPFALMHPLCGGTPIDLAWSSLRLFEDAVLPAFD